MYNKNIIIIIVKISDIRCFPPMNISLLISSEYPTGKTIVVIIQCDNNYICFNILSDK